MEIFMSDQEFQSFFIERFNRLERKIDLLSKRHNPLNGRELLDTQDLCLLLNASKSTLLRYRKKGVLPFHFIERKVFYKLSDIHELISKSFEPTKI